MCLCPPEYPHNNDVMETKSPEYRFPTTVHNFRVEQRGQVNPGPFKDGDIITDPALFDSTTGTFFWSTGPCLWNHCQAQSEMCPLLLPRRLSVLPRRFSCLCLLKCPCVRVHSEKRKGGCKIVARKVDNSPRSMQPLLQLVWSNSLFKK